MPARAAAVVVGVNLVNGPDQLSVPQKEAIFNALQAAGVSVIRAGIKPDAAGIDFAVRAQAHGIRLLWLLHPMYDGPGWLSRPTGFTGLWVNDPGLSHAAPDKFRAYAASLLDRLEARGVVLAGLELGNEVNWSNADLEVPGTGRILGAGDLLHDPEGQRVAAGYLRYMKLLAVLKDLRDHSRLNRQTPILSAGLAGLDDSAVWLRSVHRDAVSVSATLSFWRAHGLDKFVDGYGLHLYPKTADPGTPGGAAMRLAEMQRDGLTQCAAAGAAAGKPCWITEWNFNGLNTGPCPVDDRERTMLVREVRTDFTRWAAQGRLRGLFFYTWEGNIHAAHEDPESAIRCGVLTESGRLAIAPLAVR